MSASLQIATILSEREASTTTKPRTIRVAPNRTEQEIELLYRVSDAVDKSDDLPAVLSPVLEALAEHLELRHGTITLFNRKTGNIMIEAAHGLSSEQTSRGRYKLGEGATGMAVESGEAVVIPNAAESQLFVNRTNRLAKGDFSFICVPIKIGKEVAGTLSVDRECQPKEVLAADQRLLTIVASMIAQAVKVKRAAQEDRERLEEENARLRAELQNRFRPANIIGNSREMQTVYDHIALVAKGDATVLIEGETGTGKELVAQAIHYHGPRADRPFVKVHCGALSETIIESELFGHEKGAFTGALNERKGRFELAHGGTLFLDEIGEVSLNIQTKLLRVIQEGEFERVGGTKTLRVDVRLIAATNKNLPELCAKGLFREDLYYRLNVFPIFMPPLRKRKADIVLLADFFLEKYAAEYGKSIKRLSSAAIDMLYVYHWPGNVRELENVIERAVVVCNEQVVHPHHLPPTLQTAEASGTAQGGILAAMVDTYEKDIITDALKSSRGNVAGAARTLGTTQRILGYKVKKYAIDPKKHSS